MKVEGLAHLSFLFLITCGDIYNERNYARSQSVLCGAPRVEPPLCRDNNWRYVRGHKKKLKNRLLHWYKQSNYEIFHGKYMLFMHE